VAPWKAAADLFKQGVDSKDFTKSVEGIEKVAEVAVRATEEFSKATEKVGTVLRSEDKHSIAKQAIVTATGIAAAAGASALNKKVDVPYLPENAEEVLFSTIISAGLDALIHGVVARLNKHGWKL